MTYLLTYLLLTYSGSRREHGGACPATVRFSSRTPGWLSPCSPTLHNLLTYSGSRRERGGAYPATERFSSRTPGWLSPCSPTYLFAVVSVSLCLSCLCVSVLSSCAGRLGISSVSKVAASVAQVLFAQTDPSHPAHVHHRCVCDSASVGCFYGSQFCADPSAEHLFLGRACNVVCQRMDGRHRA